MIVKGAKVKHAIANNWWLSKYYSINFYPNAPISIPDPLEEIMKPIYNSWYYKFLAKIGIRGPIVINYAKNNSVIEYKTKY
jgi:hypothetical protein